MFTIESGRAAEGVVEYHREEIGEWLGEGAEDLGLPVGQAVPLATSLAPILAGNHPFTLQRLVQRISHKRIPAFEAVVASPKSISLAAHGMLPGVPARQAQDAHREAVGVVCGEVARMISEQKGGQGRPIILAIEHTRSRADEVHLHTHLVLPNMVRRGDHWFAFNDGQLFRAKLWLDSVFSHALGLALSRAGLTWQRPEPRRLELTACPAELIAAHSSSRQVTAASPAERARILRDTRAFKVGPEPQFAGAPVKDSPAPSLSDLERIDQAILQRLETGRSKEPSYSVQKHVVMDLLRMDFAAPLSALRAGVRRFLDRAREWTKRALDLAVGIFRIGPHEIHTQPDPFAPAPKAEPISQSPEVPPPAPQPSSPDRHDPPV